MNIHIGDTVEARVAPGGDWFIVKITDIWCFKFPYDVMFNVQAPDGLVGGAIPPSNIRFPVYQPQYGQDEREV